MIAIILGVFLTIVVPSIIAMLIGVGLSAPPGQFLNEIQAWLSCVFVKYKAGESVFVTEQGKGLLVIGPNKLIIGAKPRLYTGTEWKVKEDKGRDWVEYRDQNNQPRKMRARVLHVYPVHPNATPSNVYVSCTRWMKKR